MITLYHNPITRSLRVRWLLEKLDLDYTLKTVEFVPHVDGEVLCPKHADRTLSDVGGSR
ncbi:hypothetical protein [Leptolyngbya sp. CCY15150]|uniref:hypothetical protein n=1 Tax=Leptolyngbya sp. CCY15150 TaxID=2767772 RepID=UPI001950BA67|nr:hypothetical protein [Leptolyngbya sp. CCY15150]